MIWLLPGALGFVLLVPVVLALRRCGAEASGLRREVVALGKLKAPVSALRDDVAALRAEVPLIRGRTRPALPPAP